jgi:DNA repair protein RadA/Sms
VWELRADGLHTVDATETVFLPPAPEKSSRVIGTITEGTRAFLVEIQALITPTSLPYPDRTVTGFDSARLKMLIAVLQRYGGVSLRDDDVFVNVVGGWQGDDTALDAAVIMALSLAKKGNSVEQSTYILIGEVGLDGFIRPGKGIVSRLKAAQKISQATIIAPLNPDREMFPSIKVASSCAELIKLIS